MEWPTGRCSAGKIENSEGSKLLGWEARGVQEREGAGPEQGLGALGRGLSPGTWLQQKARSQGGELLS